jgi:hypothetical protein
MMGNAKIGDLTEIMLGKALERCKKSRISD